MKIGSIMTRPVVTLDARARVADGLRELGARSFRHLVLLEDEVAVGVLCRCDFDRETPSVESLFDLCTRTLLYTSIDASAFEAARMMRASEVGCLPVVENGHLVGIVSRSDLRRALGERIFCDALVCDYCGGASDVDEDPRVPDYWACRYCRDPAFLDDEWLDLGGGG